MNESPIPVPLDYEFITKWNGLAELIHEVAVEKGWWEEPDAAKNISAHITEYCPDTRVRKVMLDELDKLADRNDAEILALIHSGISEALEGLRDGNPLDDKLPEFSSVEVELADVVIRIMDAAQKRGWKVPAAIMAKVEFNKNRSYKHGGKKF